MAKRGVSLSGGSGDVTNEENVQEALDSATLPTATVATGDKVLIKDIDDSNNLKTATAQSIADLAGGGGGGAVSQLSSATANNDANIVFNDVITSDYAYFVISVTDILPASDGQFLMLEISTDNGATWLSSNYKYIIRTIDSSKSVSTTSQADVGASVFALVGAGVGSAAGEAVSGLIHVFDPTNTVATRVTSHTSHGDISLDASYSVMGGYHSGTTAVDAFRLRFGSGNISSGTATLYGVTT